MISDAVTAVRAAVDPINDRSLGGRAAEILDPSFIRHDLAQLFRDNCWWMSEPSGCGSAHWAGGTAVGGRGCHGGQRSKSWQRRSQVVPGVA
jgi:hypothetical protein